MSQLARLRLGLSVSLARPVSLKALQARAATLAGALGTFAGGRYPKARFPVLETDLSSFLTALRGYVGWNNLMNIGKEDDDEVI